MVGSGMVGSGSRGMLGICGVRLGKAWQDRRGKDRLG